MKLFSLAMVFWLIFGLLGVAAAQEDDYGPLRQEIERCGYRIVGTGVQYGIPYAEIRISRGFSINSLCRRLPSFRTDFIRWRDRIAFFNALNPFFVKTAASEPFSIETNVLKIPLNLSQSPEIFPSVDHSLGAYDKYLLVDISKGFLAFYRHGELERVFPVSAGAAGRSTPLFSFRIQKKLKSAWSSRYDTWMPYALCLKAPYFIHGGALPGKADSAGCIRMFEQNARELFDLVDVGTPGRIVHTSDSHPIRSASLPPETISVRLPD